MRLTICDFNAEIIAEAERLIGERKLPDVRATSGNLLALTGDAAVSPANSLGHRDGGIDLAYSRKWGWGVQDRLQAEIVRRPMGELLVGEALVIETGDAAIPFMIAAPTMRRPRPILDDVDVFLASKAAFLAAREREFEHVLMPGMGTYTGRVKPRIAVDHMLSAYAAVFRD